MTNKFPSIQKIRSFAKSIGIDLPLQNPEYPGAENLLHELGHWAVFPDGVLNHWREADRLNCKERGIGYNLKAKGLIPSWRVLRHGWVGLCRRHLGKYPYESYYPQILDDWWWTDAAPYDEDRPDTLPNEYGVMAWVNGVCNYMGWPRVDKQRHWFREPQPVQLESLGICPEKGIFRPTRIISVKGVTVRAHDPKTNKILWKYDTCPEVTRGQRPYHKCGDDVIYLKDLPIINTAFYYSREAPYPCDQA